MTGKIRVLLAIATLAYVGAVGGASAQTYRLDPLYPYVAQPQYYPQQQQQYVVPRAYPYVRPHVAKQAVRPRKKVNHALIAELRDARKKKLPRIDSKVVVRGKPIVVERHRVVDDPPIVVQRHITVDENREAPAEAPARAGRVIRAEAEVTILGPDRMSIRLFRKRGFDGNAKAN